MLSLIHRQGSPSRARSLGKDQHGIAMTEFALVLPLLLLVVLGGLELTNLALSHLRVSQVATTIADNAGRVLTRMDETDVEEIFAGAEVAGKGLDIENRARVVLSSVQDNGRPGSAKGQMIGWQRCVGGKAVPPAYGRENAGRNDASLKDGVGPPGRQIRAPEGSAVMFVEVTYEYKPLVSGITGTTDIRYESAFPVRERDDHSITNTRGRPRKTC